MHLPPPHAQRSQRSRRPSAPRAAGPPIAWSARGGRRPADRASHDTPSRGDRTRAARSPGVPSLRARSALPLPSLSLIHTHTPVGAASLPRARTAPIILIYYTRAPSLRPPPRGNHPPREPPTPPQWRAAALHRDAGRPGAAPRLPLEKVRREVLVQAEHRHRCLATHHRPKLRVAQDPSLVRGILQPVRPDVDPDVLHDVRP